MMTDAEAPDHLLLVEHQPAVITMGRSARPDHLLFSREELSRRRTQVVESDRGGDVTWHGPGQLVAWPLINLNRHGRDIHSHLRRLEETIILLLREFDLKGERVEGLTGVWVGDEKIAACGVAVRRWVTRHGLSLNVGPDLSGFQMIVPCGIHDRGVTSLSLQTGRDLTVDAIKPSFLTAFRNAFEYE